MSHEVIARKKATKAISAARTAMLARTLTPHPIANSRESMLSNSLIIFSFGSIWPRTN